MLRHYLKIALRQICKNKVQYLLSIIGIAIGLLCFSITSYYIRRNNNQFTAWENSDRMARVSTASTHYYNYASIPGKALQALLDSQVAGIEKIAYSVGYGQSNITINTSETQETSIQCGFQEISPDFISVFGLQTVNRQIPTLKPGEVLISESTALKIFGKENPIGKTLYFSRADNDTTPIRYSTINAVIRDLPDGTREKTDLYFPRSSEIHPEQYFADVTVLLAPGTSSTEVNKRLKQQIPPYGEDNKRTLAVRTLTEEMRIPENIGATLFIPLIGSLILIAAMINFLKFCIQSFYNRTRELSLRKSLGSDSKGLFCLLFSEIAILFFISALASLACTELLMPAFYQYLAAKEMLDNSMWIHIPTLMRQEIEYLCVLFILCLLIATWTILRIKSNQLIEGVKNGKRQKHGIRNFMLGFQLFICFLFIAGGFGLGRLFLLADTTRYNTLTEKECLGIWRIELWEPQLRGHEEDIINQIQTAAGVDDIQSERIGATVDYITKQNESIHGIQNIVSPNYAQFMKLPIEGRMPQAPNEIAVSRSLIWELEKEGEKEFTSVQLGKNLYQVTGVYEQLPFEGVYDREQIMRADQYHRFSFISVPEKPNFRFTYIKCKPGQEENVRKEILRIIRTRLPESIPFLITSKMEERLRQNGGALVISELFMLLSAISLLITILGIYSAISLDTFSRRKEVAIRKINGATISTIALLFGKLYIRLLAFTAIPALAMVYLFLKIMTQKEILLSSEWLNNPFMWLGIISLVSGIVFITVAYRIRQVSRINPAEIIKAE